jgi:hypothetical protein
MDVSDVRPVLVKLAPVVPLPYGAVGIVDTFSCDPQPPPLRGGFLRHVGGRGLSWPNVLILQKYFTKTSNTLVLREGIKTV